MIPLTHGLILAAILFVLGLTGLVIRRNLLFMLIGLEIMINASALAFVVAGSYWGQTDGQVMYILAISLAAAEASIGLALLLALLQDSSFAHLAGSSLIAEGHSGNVLLDGLNAAAGDTQNALRSYV